MSTEAPTIDADGLALMTKSITSDGYTFADFMGVDENQLEAGYAKGFELIDQGKAAKAEEMFRMLCQLDHYQPRFWLGLGVSRQMQKKYQPAVEAYAQAGIHDVKNPVPALRAAECYMAQGRWEEAVSGAEAALHWCEKRPGNDAVKDRAQMVLNGAKAKLHTHQQSKAGH